MKYKHSQKRIGSTILIILLTALVILIISDKQEWQKYSAKKLEPRVNHNQRYAGDLIEYEGKKYQLRNNLTTILLLGIDRNSDADVQGYRNGGQADFLRLVVLDDDKKTVSQVQIDRDTMTPITVLGVLGNPSGVRTAQISLAHSFGDGGKQSCLLTVDAVSELFNNVPIDFYFALNFDGISEFNDRLGGITVTLNDDFTKFDPMMKAGTTLQLKGEQAEIYVRGRLGIENDTNEARMDRQEEYISQATMILKAETKETPEFAGVLYDALATYFTTNISRGRLMNEVWATKEYENTEIIELPGTHEIAADGFIQFHIDKNALDRTVVDLFYREVE